MGVFSLLLAGAAGRAASPSPAALSPLAAAFGLAIAFAFVLALGFVLPPAPPALTVAASFALADASDVLFVMLFEIVVIVVVGVDNVDAAINKLIRN